MGVRIIEDNEGHAALYDSVKDVAFGPVFYDLDETDVGERGASISAGEVAEEFLKFLEQDARRYDHYTLMSLYARFWHLIEERGWYGVFGEEVGSSV